MGAEYWVAPDGDDFGPGTSDQPWRTIQQGANRAQPGDTIFVRSGHYSERVTTARGGTGSNARIVFRAVGLVEMRGWIIQHPFITIDGFGITGHTASTTREAYIWIRNEGDHSEILNCRVHDGIEIVDDSVEFRSASNAVVVPRGGLLAAGFAPGTFVVFFPAARPLTVTNSALYLVTNVTDQVLQVRETLVDEGPKPVYISGSYCFGLNIESRVLGCLVQSNRFSRLSYDGWIIGGTNHVIEANILEECGGWDAMHFGGSGHVFRRNLIRNSPLRVYQVSPDAMENYTPIPYADTLFEENMVIGFAGVIASQKGSGTMPGLRIVRNVFVDVGWLDITHPNTVIEGNTFLRVASTNTPVTSRVRHPITVRTSSGATNAVIRNNIFIGCGEVIWPSRLGDIGWYEIVGPTNTVVAEGNFVAGSPPDFPPKTSWPESPALNGGDPGFLNIDDPLGPDGWPFTEDDGLQLRPDSRLIGAGAGGATPGAYGPVRLPPVQLEIAAVEGAGQIRLQWPVQSVAWRLETATNLQGPWDQLTNLPSLQGDRWEVVIEADQPTRFFRLRR